jgi:hypothetical protein
MERQVVWPVSTVLAFAGRNRSCRLRRRFEGLRVIICGDTALSFMQGFSLSEPQQEK